MLTVGQQQHSAHKILRHLSPKALTSTSQGDHAFSTMIFLDFSMTKKKMNFHDLSTQHIFFEINDTRFMNAYQNKNIFPVAHQSVSK